MAKKPPGYVFYVIILSLRQAASLSKMRPATPMLGTYSGRDEVLWKQCLVGEGRRRYCRFQETRDTDE